ncbi:DUF563 domain-containing protein [Roseomonas sp. 18066]|uniref:glycosyltransferase family 61 protein n=1 Tax=Roseomonas sp. 18066 TaxID=2681412 RepID=UPI001F1B571D|nr:glycosyltransferase family 61 protein [Roseomonas sp. 18066]
MVSPTASLALELSTAKLAKVGQWQALCDDVLKVIVAHSAAALRPRTWLYLTTAAAETRSEPALKAVIAAGMDHVLPPHIRAEIALRLSTGQQQEAALEILLHDPALLLNPNLRMKCVAVLNRAVAQRADQSLTIRARDIRNRLFNRHAETPAARQALHGFVATPAIALQLSPQPEPLTIFNAAAIPPTDLAEIRQREADFSRRLHNPPLPRVRQYEDVFVNRQGQIWQADGTVLHDAGRLLVPSSLQAQTAADHVSEAVLAIERAGFYHWYAEWLPSLFWTLQASASEIPYLLHDQTPTYQLDALTMLRKNPFPLRRVGDALHVGRLYVADRHIACMGNWQAYAEGFGILADQALASTAERIYLTRRDTARRPLLNEAQLEVRLSQAGFHCVALSELTLAEQIGLVQGAGVVVAPHGASMVHLLGRGSGKTVFEIMPVLTRWISIRHNMVRISQLRGHRHALHVVRPNILNHEWSVDVGQVVDEIQRFAERKTPRL